MQAFTLQYSSPCCLAQGPLLLLLANLGEQSQGCCRHPARADTTLQAEQLLQDMYCS
jgi:hypothetical protein